MDVYKTHAFEKEINANPLEILKRDKKDREFRNDDRGGQRKPQGGPKKETKES
jgi:hypothetical protein